MFTLIAADADDDETEITDPVEIAEIFREMALAAYEAGISLPDLHTLIDAAIERGDEEMN